MVTKGLCLSHPPGPLPFQPYEDRLINPSLGWVCWISASADAELGRAGETVVRDRFLPFLAIDIVFFIISLLNNKLILLFKQVCKDFLTNEMIY